MKDWFLSAIDGAVGFVVKGIIAAIVGAAVAIGYDEVWKYIYHVPWLLFFANKVMSMMDPSVLKSLTPTAIGAAAAGASFAGLQGWFIARLKHGNRVVQEALNASPAAPNVKVDGIIVHDGETVQSLQTLSRAAYEKIYPDDTANRGGDGMPEVRKPLPN